MSLLTRYSRFAVTKPHVDRYSIVSRYEQIIPYFKLGRNKSNSLEDIRHFKISTGKSQLQKPLYPPAGPFQNVNDQKLEMPDPKGSVTDSFTSMNLEGPPEHPDRPRYPTKLNSQMRDRTNLGDLRAFEKLLDLERQASWRLDHSLITDSLITGNGDFNLFGTHYSVGFTRVKLESRDCIFAVDGVPTPLLLRRHPLRGSACRLVGECYLWAALDTGKVLTQTIEIY